MGEKEGKILAVMVWFRGRGYSGNFRVFFLGELGFPLVAQAGAIFVQVSSEISLFSIGVLLFSSCLFLLYVVHFAAECLPLRIGLLMCPAAAPYFGQC